MERKLLQYISQWCSRCYTEDIPDSSPDEIRDMVPSYQRIALAILRNDHTLKSLGFTPPKSEYYNMLKKIEIQNRGNV